MTGDDVMEVVDVDDRHDSRQQQQQQRQKVEAESAAQLAMLPVEDYNYRLEDLLTKQLEDAQALLAGQHAVALRTSCRYTDAISRLESQTTELLLENEGLRRKLLAAGLTVSFHAHGDTGGSGGFGTGAGASASLPFSSGGAVQPARLGWNANDGAQVGGTSAGTNAVAVPAGERKFVPFFGSGQQDLDPRRLGAEGQRPAAPKSGSVSPAHGGPKEPQEPLQEMHLPGAALEEKADGNVFSIVPMGEKSHSLTPGQKVDAQLNVQKARSNHGKKHKSGDDKGIDEEPGNDGGSDHSGPQTQDSKALIRRLHHSGHHPEGPKPPKAVFADANAMKEKLRKNLGVPEYNVADFYTKKGIWQMIARHHIFENTTLSVIALNALWIAIDTDNNDAELLLEAEPIFQFAENTFCTYFLFEWTVRFLSFKRKRDGLRDSWFVFDSCLVFLSLFETWVLSFIIYFSSGDDGGGGGGLGNAGVLKLFRLVRLSRMARMARLFKAMPELMIMIKGMAVAMRSVFFTLCLLVCIVYIFAIAFVQLMGPRGALQPLSVDWDTTLFPSVTKAMVTLLLGGTMPDEADLIMPVGDEHPVMWCFIMLYILLAGLTVMNMLVGVLCEVVSVVSNVEKEQMLVNFVKAQLHEMLVTSGIDTDGDSRISKKEFDQLLEKPLAARALQEVGVDVIGLVDFTDFIFQDGVELTFGDFMEVVLSLRGTNTATVKDIIDLRKLVVGELTKITSLLHCDPSKDFDDEHHHMSHIIGSSASGRVSAHNPTPIKY
eukprot:TRINITY_DN21486_c0_g1_i1.p1 TRINITY_DN21486_c0_g1~~TRINITY_DN21486_c0_g1_i1.p1  ORF type:complete len:772 (-),score=187.67 TRINITY_DN21486_c0_g1_i1:362-2677(-)